MRRRLTVCVAAAALLAAAAALGDYTTGRVSGLTARQRYPWNGLVDITFTLSGPESGYCIAVTATNMATGAEIPVRTLRDASGNSVSRFKWFAPGAVSLVWDADADTPGTIVESLALFVDTAPPCGKVQLWEGGPYWAETNIGANKPWEYGLYFWWGDTVGYRREGNAWVASDGSSENFSFDYDYAPTCGKSISTLQSEGWTTTAGVLAPEHDAAHVHWGGNWRMPTKQELNDLNSKCDWTWMTMNGVNGYVVRGRDDYASASIFLPAACHGNGTSLYYDSIYGYYHYGFYWSSVPDSDFGNDGDSSSWRLYFYWEYYRGNRSTSSTSRCEGFSVRPVQGFNE